LPGLEALAAGSAAILFGVYADLAYNTYSATNSSPQTTELFAGERSDTLWKYVKLGGAQVLVLGAFGALLAGKLWMWPILGVVAVMIAMHMMYSHALKAGTNRLESG
jgi:hypothetical protein